MNKPLDIDAARSLRTFAEQNGEIAFAHLVTTALAGEAWAIERIRWALEIADANVHTGPILAVIRATDTSRPDGAIARCGLEP